MKIWTFTPAIAWALGVSAASMENMAVSNPQIMDWEAAPQGLRVIPKLSEQPIIDGAQRKEILYGPYTLGAGDMVSRYSLGAKTPCNNCYVTGMSVTLKFADGREALPSDGIWLHHCLMLSGATMVLSNADASRRRGVIWAAANERPTLRLNSKFRYGIDWPMIFSYLVDLASERRDEVDVNLAINFEFIPKASPQGQYYRGAFMYWNSIGDPWDIPKGKVYYESTPWRSTMNGKLLWTSGHVHDGGTAQVMFINGAPVCNSTQFYANNGQFEHNMHNGPLNGPPAYGGPNAPAQGNYGPYAAPGYGPQQAPAAPQGYPPQQGPPGPNLPYNLPAQGNANQPPYNDPNRPLQYNYKRQNHGGAFGGDHIERPGACTDFGDIKRGDLMTTRAYYDMINHKPMTHKGEEERVMGNMRVFIGPTD